MIKGKPSANDASDFDIGWACGIFEGEGSVFVQHNSLRLNLNTTDRDVAVRMCELLGGRTYGPYEPRKSLGKKPKWLWIMAGSGSLEALERFYPHLSERRTQQADKWLAQYRAIRERWAQPKACIGCATMFVPPNPEASARTKWCSVKCRNKNLMRKHRAKTLAALRSTDSE